MTELAILTDLANVRSLILQRVAAGQIREIDDLFTKIARDIQNELTSAKPLTEEGARRVNAIVRDLQAMVSLPVPDLSELALNQADNVIKNLASVSVEARLPSLDVLNRIASSNLVEGALIGDWFKSIEQQTRFEVARTIKAGVAAGRTNYQIAKDITGYVVDKQLGKEALKKANRDVSAVVRTAVQSVANESAMAVYQANSDVIKGLEYVATLDSRTTIQCSALDGQRWRLDGTPFKGTTLPFKRPPIHFACRSTIVGITEFSDKESSTRASKVGQISASINFEKFMDRQGEEFATEILGKGRYEFYKQNKLTLSQLIDPRSLTPLSLKELREKF